MELSVKNVGIIESANIKLDGLTVLTGENDTGKTTIAKILFSIYSGFNDFMKNMEEYKVRLLRNDLIRIFKLIENTKIPFNKKFRHLIFHDFFYSEKNNELLSWLIELKTAVENSNDIGENFEKEIVRYINQTIEKINSLEDKETLKKFVFDVILKREFYGQINNLFSENPAQIVICQEDEKEAFISIIENSITECFINDFLSFKDAIFLDSAIDIFSFDSPFTTHGNNLKLKIFSKIPNENILDLYLNTKKHNLVPIENIFRNVLTGNIVKKMDGKILEYNINGKNIKIENLASGLKVFIVLRLLYENGYISRESLLIIDEPETHLHPKWQLDCAELLTLFVKELEANILLISHSPYFIEAIEVFSEHYKIEHKTNFYLATKKEPHLVVFENVTQQLENVYKLLSFPFDKLEEIRERDMMNGN